MKDWCVRLIVGATIIFLLAKLAFGTPVMVYRCEMAANVGMQTNPLVFPYCRAYCDPGGAAYIANDGHPAFLVPGICHADPVFANSFEP